MRLFLCYEESFRKCILYTIIFDSNSVQSLSEERDFDVNFIIQALQNQFSARLLQKRWHQISAEKMTQSKASFRDNTTFSFREVLIELIQCCIPSSLIKIFLYAMSINNFIASCICYSTKTKFAEVLNHQ